MLDGQMPAGWQVKGSVRSVSRTEDSSVVGTSALQVAQTVSDRGVFWQQLSPGAHESVSGKVVTVGAWICTDLPAKKVALPWLADGGNWLAEPKARAGVEW